jgi:hypothetical protein
MIEQVAWEEYLDTPANRAEAFTISAMIYGDLSHSDCDALDKHIRERVAARRAFLESEFSAANNNHN